MPVITHRETSRHTHTVIFLHGRDSNSQEFAEELFESEASEPAGQPRTLPDLFPSIRWVFPTAPTLHSKRFDVMMSQWFDMWSVEEPEKRVELQIEGLKSSPIFLGHSIDDSVVPIENGKRMRDILVRSLRLNVQFHEYENGGHWFNEPQGIDDIVEFIHQHM
ncbi:hypothetical protein A1O1_03276 [Capronia coronata CBS 617.96]|uniref:Phospholipase/carboxylesterase/thioesterase domain-containing protein n=1 Tax=Capronia coronata CBS 617.96 TaxID=1182541 RepID=W9YPQ6_9EURO|nr:uncharacterized protein A1O1_03276 [Capronia coronata CBS 617.96]EXJ94877.1 hypothetical protein A1O1_03276 [Capronia coronata CBS 617.96]